MGEPLTPHCLHHLQVGLLYGHGRQVAQGLGLLPIVEVIQG